MVKKKTNKLQVGIIIDNIISSEKIYDYIKMSRSSNNYEVTHLIIQNTSKYRKTLLQKVLDDSQRIGIKKVLSKITFKILCKFEMMIVKKLKNFSKFYNKYDLTEFALKVVEVEPIISKTEVMYNYNAEDILKIKSLGLNLLIKSGNEILRGEILNVCKNGVISLYYGDNYINRCGPSSFWQTMNKKERTGFTIQRLKDELNGNDILFKGYVPTLWMYTLNYVTLVKISNPFLHHVINDITSNDPKFSVKEKKPYCQLLCTSPSIIDQIFYVYKTLNILYTKIIYKILGRNLRWSVSYQFVEDWKNIMLCKLKRIPNPPNRFLADPFVIKKNNSHFCFVEDYDYKKKRGHISVYEITKDHCKEIGIALEEIFHLSYPFLFEYDGNLYMCPETSETKDIRLYKCINFPLQWKYEKKLISNVSAVDTNIFFKNNKWWLMTNIATNHIDHCSELHIFSSDNPLSNNWKSHSLNPVIFNSLNARNGGFISDMGEQYRVFQRQGFNLYGESLGVSRIVKLSNNEYEEIFEFKMIPKSFNKIKSFSKIKGTHTYNFSEGLLTLDTVEISTHRNSN